MISNRLSSMNINNNFRQKSSNKLVNRPLLHLYSLWQDSSLATLPHTLPSPAPYPPPHPTLPRTLPSPAPYPPPYPTLPRTLPSPAPYPPPHPTLPRTLPSPVPYPPPYPTLPRTLPSPAPYPPPHPTLPRTAPHHPACSLPIYSYTVPYQPQFYKANYWLEKIKTSVQYTGLIYYKNCATNYVQ